MTFHQYLISFLAGKPLFGFKGCIKEPKLKNQALPFSGTSDIVQSVAAHKVGPNCKDSGLCSEDKCPRFSVCMNTLSSYHCQCLAGHYGMEIILFSFLIHSHLNSILYSHVA